MVTESTNQSYNLTPLWDAFLAEKHQEYLYGEGFQDVFVREGSEEECEYANSCPKMNFFDDICNNGGDCNHLEAHYRILGRAIVYYE
jgi:hypothetical protein|tara:strand:+ start:108 stop:368 length:261 start_codon:yes stop_codon:yes gene_type:complete